METTRIYRLSDTDRKKEKTVTIIPSEKKFRIKNIIDLDTGTDYVLSSVYREGNSLFLDPKCFSSGSELFMTITVNGMPYEFLKTLIDLRVSEVSSREDLDLEKHWIVAAIRDETIFTPLYNKATLDDVDVDVGIHVGKHYSTVLQNFDTPLLRLIRVNQDILKAADMGNRNLMTVSKRRRQNILQREMKKRKENIYTVLSNLCLPNKFIEYLNIDNPNISIVDSRRSDSLLTLSDLILPIPSGMKVNLFTTLDQNKPAQKGNLLFSRKNFQDDVEKILRNFYKL